MSIHKREPDEEQANIARYEEVEEIIAESEWINGQNVDWEQVTSPYEEINQESYMMDIDRMVNEGLGGGEITVDNGFIGGSTTDSMIPEPKSREINDDFGWEQEFEYDED
ncbi:hypothetical protein [Paenibacillus pini]|uniref:Uncharacterized protein n=1 Tax=Paenibacillus pini JCM 16418 TaxID=1236976 RepID=W7YI24_9BACL|nr:hypothetical protein [Paenibacillus pini]GAF08097.1 hypothetical protein JCM16418_2135 [Paenibacillus pini JCM 16418]